MEYLFFKLLNILATTVSKKPTLKLAPVILLGGCH